VLKNNNNKRSQRRPSPVVLVCFVLFYCTCANSCDTVAVQRCASLHKLAEKFYVICILPRRTICELPGLTLNRNIARFWPGDRCTNYARESHRNSQVPFPLSLLIMITTNHQHGSCTNEQKLFLLLLKRLQSTRGKLTPFYVRNLGLYCNYPH